MSKTISVTLPDWVPNSVHMELSRAIWLSLREQRSLTTAPQNDEKIVVSGLHLIFNPHDRDNYELPAAPPTRTTPTPE